MDEDDKKIPPIQSRTPDSLAFSEVKGFAEDQWKMRHAKFRSIRDLWLSYVLFIFVIGINVWWDGHIISWIRSSGTSGSWFHLSDTVLIALATTSVANFIGLVAIVAKHLFPEIKDDQISR